MKVIFIKDLKGQGKKDEIKEVKDGYGMNFLIKKGYAVTYTECSVKRLDNEQMARQKKENEEIEKSKRIKKELEKKKIQFKVKTGEKDKVFGSISSKQISNELKKLGYDVDKKKINMRDTLSCLGFHNVEIELHKKVILQLKVELVKE